MTRPDTTPSASIAITSGSAPSGTAIQNSHAAR